MCMASFKVVSSPNDGLILHLPLNENTADKAFDATGEYSSSLLNGAVWASGKWGSSVVFDDLNNSI